MKRGSGSFSSSQRIAGLFGSYRFAHGKLMVLSCIGGAPMSAIPSSPRESTSVDLLALSGSGRWRSFDPSDFR
jgi:hypothetical protein